ncbi:ABC transporter substrate-binding protein [Acidaminococcus timonensis]|uniref:ABC transporter substrate-binding protein n=1 Tax=Acidaminococcus timonensis TaxID=1871002 RepID=UPI00307C7313
MKLLQMFLLLCLLLVSGCGGQPAAHQDAAITLQDVRGKTVTLPRNPQRILTDSLHLDETLLTLVPADHLAGAYYLDGEPGISYISKETAAVDPKLRDYTPETVAAVKPDLFLASTWSDPGLLQKLEALGIPVVVCHGPTDLEQIRDNVELVAKAVGKPATGKKVLARFDRQLEDIRKTMQQQSGPQPTGMLVSLMSRYGGSGSLYDVVCREAGIRNGLAAAGLKNGQALTREAVLQTDPDFFLVSLPYGEEKEAYDKFSGQFFSDSSFQSLKGLKHRVTLPDRYVYDASPMVVYGIKALANGAYGKKLFDLSDESLLKGY